MPQKQSLSLDQRLSMRLSAQQLRFVKLLEFNTPELEEAVARELEDNPALEAIDPVPAAPADNQAWIPLYNSQASAADSSFELTPVDSGETLYESLSRQLSERDLAPDVRQAASYVIGNLDSNGYLRRPPQGIMNDMAFGPGIEVSLDAVTEAINVVRDLEPYGVGASDLRECLIIQLRHLPKSQRRDDALEILETQFEAFSMKHTHRIISALKLDKERVSDAISLIVSLNPKPGASVNPDSERANVIVPDLVISEYEGNLTVSLNNQIPELAIERSFDDAVKQMEATGAKRKARKGSEFILSRYNDARDFIKVLAQRQETLISVMTAIMKLQHEYFMTQDVYKLRPMMIKDISAITGLDISVISRATNNKYVATPWGIFPLRFFFSDSIGDDSDAQSDTELLTNRKIEAEIKAMVEKEDKRHPLSDEKIREDMVARGYDVSRRTVAKYRDRIGIPVARLRKEL